MPRCCAAGPQFGIPLSAHPSLPPPLRVILPDGRDVAIKRRDPRSMQGLKEFTLEVELVSPLRHPAIVKIIGVASQDDNFALVYPFFKKGDPSSPVLIASVQWGEFDGCYFCSLPSNPPKSK